MTRVYHESWYPHIINDQIMYIRYVAKCIVSIMTFKEKIEKCSFIYKYLQSQCKSKNNLVFVETPYLGSRSNFCNCYNSARVQFSFIACQIEIKLEWAIKIRAWELHNKDRSNYITLYLVKAEFLFSPHRFQLTCVIWSLGNSYSYEIQVQGWISFYDWDLN